MTRDEEIQYLTHRLERMGDNYNTLSRAEKQEYKKCQARFLKITNPNYKETK
jgi:hypothetical protein